jgi:hypothetical protein
VREYSAPIVFAVVALLVISGAGVILIGIGALVFAFACADYIHLQRERFKNWRDYWHGN